MYVGLSATVGLLQQWPGLVRGRCSSLVFLVWVYTGRPVGVSCSIPQLSAHRRCGCCFAAFLPVPAQVSVHATWTLVSRAPTRRRMAFDHCLCRHVYGYSLSRTGMLQWVFSHCGIVSTAADYSWGTAFLSFSLCGYLRGGLSMLRPLSTDCPCATAAAAAVYRVHSCSCSVGGPTSPSGISSTQGETLYSIISRTISTQSQ